MGRKLGATPRFGKAAKRLIIVVRKAFCVHLRRPPVKPRQPAKIIPWQQKARANSPGLFVINTGNDQAAGL
jgi:hypothetical protein